MAGDEQFRRNRAKHDFIMMPPNERSIQKLWNQYVQLGRDDPDGTKGLRARMATNNKSLLYRWAKEDNWREDALAHDEQQNKLHEEELDTIRTAALRDMNAFLPNVIETYKDIIQNSERDDVRIRAIEGFLDRIGIVKVSITQAAKNQEDLSKRIKPLSVPMPGPDDSDEMWAKWIAARQKQN